MKKILPVIILCFALMFGVVYAVSTWGGKNTPGAKPVDNVAPAKPVDNNGGQKAPSEPGTPDNGNTDNIITKEVTLYFPDKDAMYLCPEKREISYTDNMEKAIVEAVISGPVSDDYLASVSDDVEVISITVPDDGGTCVVDLSKEFLLNNTGGSTIETFALYSIVNSLCNLPNVNDVKINIEGDTAAVYGGHYDISTPLQPDMTFVK